MKSLTIAYVTSRKQPRAEWFFNSLIRQTGDAPLPNVIVVDFHYQPPKLVGGRFPHGEGYVGPVRNVAPKPTVWQGPSRLTSEDWWAKSNALNTAICLCQSEWIAFVDDRSVLAPGWLNSVYEAMEGNYAVCGSYEKRAHLGVEDGEAIGGEILGEDTRRPGLYDFDSYYGGSGALPLEWCLQVQGFNESLCDSLGLEDSMFGTVLLNNGYPLKYDSRMRIIEDRTPGQIDGALKRADKDVHLGQRAKSWGIVRALKHETTSQNPFDIRNMRARVLAGEPFPPPTGADFDWFDGEKLADMK